MQSENTTSTIINNTKVAPFDKRIHEIDFIRGLLIALVVLDHLFNLLMSYGKTWYLYSGETLSFFLGQYNVFKFYWESDARAVIRPICLMLFCLISGVSCAFSKNNWKRAIETIAVWLIIVFGSWVMHWTKMMGKNRDIIVYFDIIGVLGISMLIYCFIQKKSWRMIVAFILIFCLIYNYTIPNLKENLINYCGSEDIGHAGHITTVPRFFMPLFWEPASCFGGKNADYCALFPYIIFFFIGALISYFFYKDKRKSYFKKHNFERPICFIGRHTLIIYMVHELALTALFGFVNLIMKMCIKS